MNDTLYGAIYLTPEQMAQLIEILQLDVTVDIKTINNRPVIIEYGD